MRCPEHDKIYSGRTNLRGQFEWICTGCGEIGWADSYVLSSVNHTEFYRQRVLHGWAVPGRPAPVMATIRLAPQPRTSRRWLHGALRGALYALLGQLPPAALGIRIPLLGVLVGLLLVAAGLWATRKL